MENCACKILNTVSPPRARVCDSHLDLPLQIDYKTDYKKVRFRLIIDSEYTFSPPPNPSPGLLLQLLVLLLLLLLLHATASGTYLLRSMKLFSTTRVGLGVSGAQPTPLCAYTWVQIYRRGRHIVAVTPLLDNANGIVKEQGLACTT